MFTLALFLEGFIGSLFSGVLGQFLCDIIRHLVNDPTRVLQLKYVSVILDKIVMVFLFAAVLSLAYLLFVRYGRIYRSAPVRKSTRVDNKTSVFSAVFSQNAFTFIKKDMKFTA